MQIEVTPTENTELTPVVTEPTEAQLIADVSEAWGTHVSVQKSLHRTEDELRKIRVKLSANLHSLKSVLSRPGRGGEWSSFLQTVKIPRSTADRLVRAHKGTLAPKGLNCTTEQTQEPTEVVVGRLLNALWPKLSRVLTTHEAIEMFISELMQRADKSFGAVEQATSGSVTESPEPTEPRI
jgi:hypothetical protein